MESVPLDGPEGITVRLGWDDRLTEHERRHRVARDVLSARLQTAPADIRLHREAPGPFGHHTLLSALVGAEEVPLLISATSVDDATVVAVADLGTPVGLDLRSLQPDDDELAEIRRHSHLFDGSATEVLLIHWRRVQAVRAADGRGARVQPEHVRLDPVSRTGWVPDRRPRYRLAELSHDGWAVTLAYGAAAH